MHARLESASSSASWCAIIRVFLIFGDNTHLTYRSEPVTCRYWCVRYERDFSSRCPTSRPGTTPSPVLSPRGLQENHVQQHWIDEALIIHVTSSHVARGLCGIPMLNIELTKEQATLDERARKRAAAGIAISGSSGYALRHGSIGPRLAATHATLGSPQTILRLVVGTD